MRRNFDITFVILIVILALSAFRHGDFADPMDWLMSELMMLPGIIIGLAFHEFAHAKVAYKLGDPTPKMQGRVTINPLAHIDPVGLAALLFVGFGWGVPVQINPSNFRHRRRDELMVALAGVTMNLIIAIVFAIIAKVLYMTAGAVFLSSGVGSILWFMIMYVIQINLVLMIFNLIPCPPLDGFSIISEIFNIKHTEFYWTLYRYGNWILIALIIFGITGMIISPCVQFFMSVLNNFIF
ncbi:MAG: site-2 protease family protein [Anaerovoracaceae bacterium]|uniref:Site-2 protease family protein n=1 Tax=Candidatus Allocopromorpha excrementipullorum TaxID=2840743 RepID=A0A9D1N5J7_9FIRM|nr:site-2 protease family protein [Anaerovoracaceae bacterium]HIU95549.1 site-2 protease family protein [Candidatus Copromorpha excrementipullorum]